MAIKNKLWILPLMFILFVSVASASLTDDLVFYYQLDETTGTVIDSVGTYNLTNYGATPNVAGKISTAYDFDGTNDYIGSNTKSLNTNNLTLNA